MSASTENYENAANKYSQLAEKYTGENGYNLANTTATKTAQEQANLASTSAGSIAGAQASKAARTSGMTRGAAAAMGANQASQAAQGTYGNTYTSAYNTGMSNAMQSNQNAVNAQQNAVSNEANIYNAKQSLSNGWLNAGANLVGGLASSDENLKDVKEDTKYDPKNIGKGISKAGDSLKNAGLMQVGNTVALSDEEQKDVKEECSTCSDKFDEYLKKLEAL